MLSWLKIKNLALVEEADIEFGGGMNVITGETGAGKSVILGTIALLLGERAEKSMIRSGEEKCEIGAGITLNKNVMKKLRGQLEEAGISIDPDENFITIRRTITNTSSRNFINDTPVALQTLKNIGDILIDVHGANEHQSLLRQSSQLQALDSYAKLDNFLDKCAELCENLKSIRQEKESLDATLPSESEANSLRLTISDIEKVSPLPDEDKELSARYSLAANSRQALSIVSSCVMALNESENSMADRLGDIYRHLNELSKLDPDRTTSYIEQCASISEAVRELAGELEIYSEKIELDEKEFTELEERLNAILSLKRRYGPSLESVFDSLSSAREMLSKYENASEIRKDLAKKESAAIEELKKVSEELSSKRKKASVSFAREVCSELKKLGFLKCDFKVDFQEIEPGPRGCDKIDFLFCPNPGEPHKPLRDIASSGEISRFMLALKTVLAGADSVPILVFDEIDANIGGETASIVGGELRKLSESHQILCISHLAQVAAQAHEHFLVKKNICGDRTITEISYIVGASRVKELTRMLGGGKGASTHAEDLFKKVNN